MKNILVISTLSLALMSGVAIAQNAQTGVGATMGTEVQDNPSPTAEEVGKAIEGAANDVGRVVGEAANDIASEIEKSANSRVEGAGDVAIGKTNAADAAVDATATASINSSSQLGVTLDAFGEVSDAFFTDETRTTVVADPEFAAAFNNLSAEQQEQLRASCLDADSAEGAAASFCTAVSAL